MSPYSSSLLVLSFVLAAAGQWFLADQGSGWVWGLVFYLAAIFIFVGLQRAQSPSEPAAEPLSSIESFLLLLVFIEALFFRFYRLDSLPSGLNPDAGDLGWWALRILRGEAIPFGKDPIRNFIYPAPNYETALWFSVFPATKYSLFAFSAFLSVASLGFIYWFFRQLSGVPTALLTLALIAPMRWDMTLARMTHVAFDGHFWMFGCLSLALWAIRTERRWPLFTSAIFLAASFYGYDAFKPLVVLVIFLVWIEVRSKPSIRGAMVGSLGLCLLLFTALTAPMWLELLRVGPANPINQNFILSFLDQRGWLSVLSNPWKSILMFSYVGEHWPTYNIPGHRMLDDGTGIFLYLGLGLTLWSWRKRSNSYVLAGFALMLLPAALTIEPMHAARSFGALPFTASFAASAIVQAGNVLARAPLFRGDRWFLLSLFLTFVGLQNGWTYFRELPRTPDFNWRSNIQQTIIGNAIAEDKGRNDYYLASHFQNDKTIQFLADAYRERVHDLPWPGGAWPPVAATGREAWFFLDLQQPGLLALYQEIYPHGILQAYQDPGSGMGVYFYDVPAKDLGPGLERAGKMKSDRRGLLGEYRTAAGDHSQVDPVLNFAYRTDFPVKDFASLTVKWEGRLKVTRAGVYQFLLLGTDQAGLDLKGHLRLDHPNQESKAVLLGRGIYPLIVHFEKTKDFASVLNFLWKKPGSGRFEVVPSDVLEAKVINGHEHL